MIRPVRLGDHNVVELYVGCVESGKTTAALRRMGDFAHCHRFAHDVNLGLKRKFPDGSPTGIVRHADFASIRDELARGDRGGIHAYTGTAIAPTELLALACTCAAQSLRPVPGEEDEKEGPPSMVMIDEIAGWDQAQASRPFPGADVVQLVGRRRPLHCGVIFTAQRPSMVHRWLMTEATRVTIFRLNDPRDVERLIEGGIPADRAELALTLPYWGDKSGEGRKRIEAGETNYVVVERA